MAERDAKWFSSYFDWGRQRGTTARENSRVVNAVNATARQEDEPTPALKRVWRQMLGKTESHPDVGGHGS